MARGRALLTAFMAGLRGSAGAWPTCSRDGLRRAMHGRSGCGRSSCRQRMPARDGSSMIGRQNRKPRQSGLPRAEHRFRRHDWPRLRTTRRHAMRAAPQPEQAGPSRPDTGATSTFPERDPDRIAAWRLAVCLSLGSAIALGLALFVCAAAAADEGRSRLDVRAGRRAEHGERGRLPGRRTRVSVAVAALASRLAAGGRMRVDRVADGRVRTTSGMHALLVQRLATGVGSALIFISGGVLAARLASASPRDAGLLLGLLRRHGMGHRRIVIARAGDALTRRTRLATRVVRARVRVRVLGGGRVGRAPHRAHARGTDCAA